MTQHWQANAVSQIEHCVLVIGSNEDNDLHFEVAESAIHLGSMMVPLPITEEDLDRLKESACRSRHQNENKRTPGESAFIASSILFSSANDPRSCHVGALSDSCMMNYVPRQLNFLPSEFPHMQDVHFWLLVRRFGVALLQNDIFPWFFEGWAGFTAGVLILCPNVQSYSTLTVDRVLFGTG